MKPTGDRPAQIPFSASSSLSDGAWGRNGVLEIGSLSWVWRLEFSDWSSSTVSLVRLSKWRNERVSSFCSARLASRRNFSFWSFRSVSYSNNERNNSNWLCVMNWVITSFWFSACLSVADSSIALSFSACESNTSFCKWAISEFKSLISEFYK